MSKNIYRPEGEELIRYLSEGYAICNKCGAVMNLNEQYNYICPGCGWEADGAEYEYDYGEELEWSPNMLDVFGEDIPPACCLACGGPYPDCMLSCKIFDE